MRNTFFIKNKELIKNQYIIFFILFFSLMLSHQVFAARYDLPASDSRLIGHIQQHVVKDGETMASIAKEYDVGFLALQAANQGVDPFLPINGYVLSIPRQLLLPDVPRKGIVVNLAELRLYYFEPTGKEVYVFPVGIGRIGRDTPEMVTSISQKRPNPTWTPPKSVRAEYLTRGIELPNVVPSGPDNPLGLFALRLAYGGGDYLIHGTNKDFGVGLRVSSGCIRLDPRDIEWLFSQVAVGLRVQIINEPIKVALEPDHSLFIEVHEPLTRSDGSKKNLELPQSVRQQLKSRGISEMKAKAAIQVKSGIPIELTLE